MQIEFENTVSLNLMTYTPRFDSATKGIGERNNSKRHDPLNKREQTTQKANLNRQ